MAEISRQEKTKYKLAAAMKECMKTTPVDRITVTSIVEGAGVTRQTFYRNFLDKYDLIARRTSRPLGEELQFLLEMYCQGLV